MKKFAMLLVVLALAGQRDLLAQDAKANPAEEPTVNPQVSVELDAIRKQIKGFVDAFNSHDAAKLAELWTVDGEYIDVAGQRFAGRDAIRQAYIAFFESQPDAKIRLQLDRLNLVGPDVAIEDGRASVDARAPAGGVSQYSAVHTKVEGKWLVASVRDQWIEPPTASKSAADLQWLIGTWAAEEHGVRIVSTCSWLANKQFMQRAYTNTQPDGTQASGLQIIGWNPQIGRVQSWDFSPDGGHAIGIWNPIEGGWLAEVEGTTADGISTSAVNQLVRLDDNAYVWQSIGRYLNGMPLPDTDEVVIKRQSSGKSSQ